MFKKYPEKSQLEGRIEDRSPSLRKEKLSPRVEEQLIGVVHPGVPRQPLPEHLEEALNEAIKNSKERGS